MKIFILLSLFISVVFPVFGQYRSAPEKKTVSIDGYAAKVNDRVITRGEIRENLVALLPNLYRNYQGAQLESEIEKAYKKVLNELVSNALIMEAFRERGGEIPDQYVNDSIKNMVRNRFNGDEFAFEKLLIEQKKTRSEYMERMREQMAVGMMVNEHITQRARVTPAQVKAEYELQKERFFIPEKAKYSAILLNKGVTEEDQAVKRKETETILQRLIDGDDFAAVAIELSEGMRANSGGEFAWTQPKDVRPELQETLKTLPAGEISEIIETDTEFYILKIHARRQAAYTEFDEVRQGLKKALNQKEYDRLKERWIDRLKKINYVIIYPM